MCTRSQKCLSSSTSTNVVSIWIDDWTFQISHDYKKDHVFAAFNTPILNPTPSYLISNSSVYFICLSLRFASRLIFILGYLKNLLFLFFLMYPWKYTTVNLPWEMAVTHDLWVSQGKEPFYHGKRTMCNRSLYWWISHVGQAYWRNN